VLGVGIITAEACLERGVFQIGEKGSVEGQCRRFVLHQDGTKTTDDDEDDNVVFVVADVNYRYYHHYRRTFA